MLHNLAETLKGKFLTASSEWGAGGSSWCRGVLRQ
jgi:hypothetical protein